jgi:antitoxin (DNA-binding transcriptional repressor) of toxin-antitoxin stability system
MLTVNIHDAKTQLSKLIAMAVKGQPFIIAKAGKPMVKVEAFTPEEMPRKSRLGGLVGTVRLPDGDQLPEDMGSAWQTEFEDSFYNGKL